MFAPTKRPTELLNLTELFTKCEQSPTQYPSEAFKKIIFTLSELNQCKQVAHCHPYWEGLKILTKKYPLHVDFSFSDHILMRIALEQQNITVLEWLRTAPQFHPHKALKHALTQGYSVSIQYLINHPHAELQATLTYFTQKIFMLHQDKKARAAALQGLSQPFWVCIKKLLECCPEKINFSFDDEKFIKSSKDAKRDFTFAQHLRLENLKNRLQIFEELMNLAVAQNNISVLEWLSECPLVDIHHALQYAINNNYNGCLPYLLGHPKLDIASALHILDVCPSEVADKIFKTNLQSYGWTDIHKHEVPPAFTTLESEILHLEIATKEATFTDPSIAVCIELYITHKLTVAFKKINSQSPDFAQLVYAALPLLHYPPPQDFAAFKKLIWYRPKTHASLKKEKEQLETLKTFFFVAFGLDDEKLSAAQKLEKFTKPILDQMMTSEEIDQAALYLEVARCRFVSLELLNNCAWILENTAHADTEDEEFEGFVPVSPTVVQFSGSSRGIQLTLITDTNKNTPPPQRDEVSLNNRPTEKITLQ